MAQVIEMVFACDHCYYLFSASEQPEQCPDCGKFAVRPATEEETRELNARLEKRKEEWDDSAEN
jgi:rRNA maturation endonuclease Nob1